MLASTVYLFPLQSLLPSLPLPLPLSSPPFHHPSSTSLSTLSLSLTCPSPLSTSPSPPSLSPHHNSSPPPFNTLPQPSFLLSLPPPPPPFTPLNSHLRLWHWRGVCSVQDTASWRTCTEGEHQSHSQTSHSFTVSFPNLPLLHSLIPKPPTPSQSHSQTSHSFTASFSNLPLLHSFIPKPPTPS